MDESESLNVKVEACTSSDLPECDWSLVFEIVDDTNVDPSFAREIVRSLRARLSSPNPKVVLLAITLYDACIKNGSDAFHRAACGRDTVSILSSVASGSSPKLAPHPEVAAAARKLIAETLVALSLQPSLCTFLQAAAESLAKQGFGLPVVDPSTITKIQPPPDALSTAAITAASGSSSSSSSRGGVTNNTRPMLPGNQQGGGGNLHSQLPPSGMMSARRNEVDVASQIALVDNAFAKLHSDLAATRGVIARSAQLLVSGSLFRSESGSNSSSNAQSIVDNVDFLGQLPPRLGALIEAGVGGVLDEDLFEECLAVNDAVARVIEVAMPLVDEIEAQAISYGSTTFSLLPPPAKVFPALSDLVSFDKKRQTAKVDLKKQDADLLTLNNETPASTEALQQSKTAPATNPTTSISEDLMGLSFPPSSSSVAAAGGGGRGEGELKSNSSSSAPRRQLDPIEFEPSPFDVAAPTSTGTSSSTSTSTTSTRIGSQVNGGVDF